MSVVIRLIIWLAVLGSLLAVGLFLGDRVQRDAGYVLVAYDVYTIEMSLWTAFIAVVLSVFLIWAIFEFGGFLKNIPSQLSFSWQSLGSKRADIRLVQGAFWLRHDDPERAFSILQQGAKRESLPALHWLLASEAARRLDRKEQSSEYLLLAESLMNKVPKQIALSPKMPQTFKLLLTSLKKNWREDWVYQLEFVGNEDAVTRLSELNALLDRDSLALEVVLARLALVLDLQAEAVHHIKRAKKLNSKHPMVACLELEHQFGRTAHLELLRSHLLQSAA